MLRPQHGVTLPAHSGRLGATAVPSQSVATMSFMTLRTLLPKALLPPRPVPALLGLHEQVTTVSVLRPLPCEL